MTRRRPRRGEVTVQLETAGLCHSDHHLLTGDFPIPSYPVLGGHEGAGIVTEIGQGGRDRRDHVGRDVPRGDRHRRALRR
ncbi:alcohol dehydrogenase catalytic domain-containing protein [Mycobacterium servetii]|uniref:alcohol dehydrogenase catalytic domain-containing protein n=1 Tax=Mycobacterium servetii TaxID=3237418 RepID=UPI00350F7724